MTKVRLYCFKHHPHLFPVELKQQLLSLTLLNSQVRNSGSLNVYMVFIKSDLPDGNGKQTGLVTVRDTGKYLGLLLLESIFGVLVAFSNLLIIIILILGWRRLVKNHFYIVLSNLIVCTSMKAVVELAFIVPYYVMQGDGVTKPTSYFSSKYELLIFNLTVFADYGVLFFSVNIAINRFLAVTRPPEDGRPSSNYRGLQTALSCIIVWLCSALIPVLFYIFDCQYEYDAKLKVYRNKCTNLHDDVLIFIFNCVIYLSYACAAVVLVLYLLIFIFLRRQRLAMRNVNRKSPVTQIQLLRQSVIVFVLYATSILSVFAMSFASPGGKFDAFDIAYTENLLNLSIAAVYPVCFLATSGEMRNILVRKFSAARNSRVSSVHLSGANNRIPRNEMTTKF